MKQILTQSRPPGTPVPVAGSARFMLTCNNGTPVSQVITGVNIPLLGIYDFTHRKVFKDLVFFQRV